MHENKHQVRRNPCGEMDPQKSTALKLQGNRIHAEPSIWVESYPALSPAAQSHLQINLAALEEKQNQTE